MWHLCGQRDITVTLPMLSMCLCFPVENNPLALSAITRDAHFFRKVSQWLVLFFLNRMAGLVVSRFFGWGKSNFKWVLPGGSTEKYVVSMDTPLSLFFSDLFTRKRYFFSWPNYFVRANENISNALNAGVCWRPAGEACLAQEGLFLLICRLLSPCHLSHTYFFLKWHEIQWEKFHF